MSLTIQRQVRRLRDRASTRTLALCVLGLAGVLGAGAIALHTGQDNSIDLLLYHYVDPFWVLKNHLKDVAPAGYQSYFNPTLDLPLYYGIRHLSPKLFTFLLGCWQGTSVPLLYLVSRQARLSRLWSVAVAGAGMFTATALAEYGSTQGDLLIAPFVLIAFVLVCRWIGDETRRSTWILAVGAASIGAAAGLKLVVAPLVIGVLAGVTLSRPGARDRLRAALVGSGGAFVGFIATYGWWGWVLWQHFESPVFPLFNSFVRSPFATPANYLGIDHAVRTLPALLTFPFTMLLRPWTTSPVPFRQASFAALEVLLALLAVIALVRAVRARRWVPMFTSPHARFLGITFVVAYVAWALTTGIYRYMLAVEMLSFLVIVLVLRELGRMLRMTRYVAPVAGACIIGLLATQQPPDFGRVPVATHFFDVDVPAQLLDRRANFIFVGDATNAFVVPSFPASDIVVRESLGFPLTAAMDGLARRELEDGAPTYVMWGDAFEGRTYLLTDGWRYESSVSALGYTIDTEKSCSSFGVDQGDLSYDIYWCPVVPTRDPVADAGVRAPSSA